jgi:hypothetical protein
VLGRRNDTTIKQGSARVVEGSGTCKTASMAGQHHRRRRVARRRGAVQATRETHEAQFLSAKASITHPNMELEQQCSPRVGLTASGQRWWCRGSRTAATGSSGIRRTLHGRGEWRSCSCRRTAATWCRGSRPVARALVSTFRSWSTAAPAPPPWAQLPAVASTRRPRRRRHLHTRRPFQLRSVRCTKQLGGMGSRSGTRLSTQGRLCKRHCTWPWLNASLWCSMVRRVGEAAVASTCSMENKCKAADSPALCSSNLEPGERSSGASRKAWTC